MSFFRTWIVEPLVSLINPAVCPLCGRLLRVGEPAVCPGCLDKLPRTQEAWHRDNKVELLFNDDKLVRGAAWCYYRKNHPIRNLTHEIKFGGRPELGEELGALLATEWLSSGFFDGIDCLIPLPLHWRRLHKRGYNQAECIARGVSRVTGIPVDTRHLKRYVNNDQQSLLSLQEREKLTNIFRVRHPEELRGKHVLLIDDIITTGNTMKRAFDALHPILRCRYSVLALAIAQGE